VVVYRKALTEVAEVIRVANRIRVVSFGASRSGCCEQPEIYHRRHGQSAGPRPHFSLIVLNCGFAGVSQTPPPRGKGKMIYLEVADTRIGRTIFK
jgi:hypothetical protein